MSNNGVQGTRHKVPGPLTPDVGLTKYMKKYLAIIVGLCALTAAADTNWPAPVIEDIPLPEPNITFDLFTPIDIEVAPSPEDIFIRIVIHPASNALPYEVNELPVDMNRMKLMLNKIYSLNPHVPLLLKTSGKSSANAYDALISLIREAGLTNINIRFDGGDIKTLEKQ